MVEVGDPPRGMVEAVARIGEIKLGHSLSHLLGHSTVLGVVVEGPMLEHNVLTFGNIHNLHLLWQLAGVIQWQPHTVASGPGITPLAHRPFGIADVTHALSAAAVGTASALVIQLTFDAVQKAADGVAVLTRNLALLFPEIPVAMALVVLNVQELVGWDGYKVDLYTAS